MSQTTPEASRQRVRSALAAVDTYPMRAAAEKAMGPRGTVVESLGKTAPTHRHSGPEAWHTVSGETCLETPEGKIVGRAGGAPVIAGGGRPMHLTATGTARRRELVLILHDSSQPASTPAEDWTPKGLCKS